MRRLLLLLASGVLIAATTAVVTEAGEGFPALAPGRSAVVTGTQVSCTVTAISATCTKVGGLTATMLRSGRAHVTRGTRTLFSAVKPIQLHVNDGFVNAGSDDSYAYCHVYLAGVPTIDCSFTGNSSGYLSNADGFDMSDRSVVVFRYDTAGNRHDIKTFPQP